MVAYSFKARFEDRIVSGEKRQTVRSNRRRHARPGEAIQLYTAMRTKHCRKLLNVDPICTAVTQISLTFDAMSPQIIQAIWIDGNKLTPSEAEAFAIADGFGSDPADGRALLRMGQFWISENGAAAHGFWTGVVIHWLPPLGET